MVAVAWRRKEEHEAAELEDSGKNEEDKLMAAERGSNERTARLSMREISSIRGRTEQKGRRTS